MKLSGVAKECALMCVAYAAAGVLTFAFMVQRDPVWSALLLSIGFVVGVSLR